MFLLQCTMLIRCWCIHRWFLESSLNNIFWYINPLRNIHNTEQYGHQNSQYTHIGLAAIPKPLLWSKMKIKRLTGRQNLNRAISTTTNLSNQWTVCYVSCCLSVWEGTLFAHALRKGGAETVVCVSQFMLWPVATVRNTNPPWAWDLMLHT